MDRQPRNIVGLLTLLIAALGSVAILSSEHHRSTLNTAILVVLAVAAAGSLLALVLGSTPIAVLRRDVHAWWNDRPNRRWTAGHYQAKEPEANIIDLDTMQDAEIRAEGMPCVVLTLRARDRTLGRAIERPMKGVDVSCVVERSERRSSRAEAVQVPPHTDDAWGAVGRWPDQWIDPDHGGPVPGYYRVRWTLRHPEGQLDHPTEKVRVVREGETHVSRAARVVRAGRARLRHYRGLDK